MDIRMKYAEFETLNSPRLILRKLKLSDAPDFYRFASDPEVCRYMLWNLHRSIDDSIQSIQTAIDRYSTGKYYRWAIALESTDQVIGIIQLLGFEEASQSCSFAYMLGKPYWNQGYATEALQLVLRFAFENMQLQSVKADHFCMNPASGRVMEKAGMRQCGILSGKYEKDGVSYDAAQYMITRDDWNITLLL